MAKKRNKGFTLVELIIVIAILAIIMLIAIPNFSGIQQRMRVRADKATAAQIGKAVRIWYTENYSMQSETVIPDLMNDTEEPAVVDVAPYDKLDKIGEVIAKDYVADSLLKDGAKAPDGGRFYVTILYSGVSAKFVVGIDYPVEAGGDGFAPTLENEIVTPADVTYDGTQPDWAYLET